MTTITIQSPTSNSTVAKSFTATGVVGGATEAYTTVSGTMQLGNNPPISGTTTQQPLTANMCKWIITFLNVPAGTGYTLTVQTSDGAMAQVGGLTVQ
jgi:hypothetical protein